MSGSPSFADELRAWRDEFLLSQARAALIFDVSVRTVQGWERDRHRNEPSMAGPIRRLMQIYRESRSGPPD